MLKTVLHNISTESRVLGSLFGMATGDALGSPTSFLTRKQVKEEFGWVNSFISPKKGHFFHDGLKAGEYTDDTEQALALAVSFLRNKKVVPQDIVSELLKWANRVKGKYVSPLGPSTERALKAIQEGADIQSSGRFGITNGSAMRISPLGIVYGLREDLSMQDLAKDVYLTCLATHNTSVCNATACAIAWGVAQCMRGEKEIGKIVQATILASEQGAGYGYEYPSPDVPTRIHACYEIILRNNSAQEAMEELYRWFGGAEMAADSIPVAIALFALGGANPEKVNEYAVNFGGDCDTNAAMAGAMAGAYSGVEAVPLSWRKGIEQANDCDFHSIALQLIELAPFWQVGG